MFLVSISLFAAKQDLHFERVIFFGDSLSDTGNFPEPNNYDSSTVPPYNLYIPISSPVKSTEYGNEFIVPQTTDVSWRYPTKLFLEESSSLKQGLIDRKTKDYRSINWVEYFVFNSFSSNSAKLIPWTVLYNASDAPNKQTSVNYAWVWAMTIDGFSNLYYKPINTKNEKELNERKQAYLNGNINIDQVAIPGVRKQVSMYFNDLKTGKIKRNNNTAYIIYIGGNDLSNTLNNDLMKLHVNKFLKTIGSVSFPGIMAMNVKNAVDEIIAKGHAKNIYIVSFLNASNLPRAYNTFSLAPGRWLLKKLITASVTSYNRQLADIFSAKSYESIVKVLPLGDALNRLASQPRFVQSVKNGLSCVSEINTSTKPKPEINNCNYNTDETYFAWNDSHLSTKVNQYAAYQIYNDIVNDHNTPKPKSNPAEDKKLQKFVGLFEERSKMK